MRAAFAGISNTPMVGEAIFSVCQELTGKAPGRVSQARCEQGFAVLSSCSAQQHANRARAAARELPENRGASGSCGVLTDAEQGRERVPGAVRERSVTIVTIRAILAAPPGAIGVGPARLEIQVSARGRRVFLCKRFSDRWPLHFFSRRSARCAREKI
jgi:hypothetical protein